MNRCRVKTARWLFGSLLCLLLIVPAEGVLAMRLRQHDGNAVLEKDVAKWSAAQPLAWENNADWFQMSKLTGVDFAEMAFFMAVFLIAYSLFTAGKRGWGWFVVSMMAGAVMIVVKVLLSMFVEVTSEYCPPDWDED